MKPGHGVQYARLRQEALRSFRQTADALGALALWDRLADLFKLESDAGAAFIVIQTLDRACQLTPGLGPTVHPKLILMGTLAARLQQQSVDAGFQARLGNNLSTTGYHAGDIADFELLAAVTTPPLDELESRIAALHLLMLAGLTLKPSVMSAALAVANASRKSRGIATWTFLVQMLPDPSEAPGRWPEAMASWSEERLRCRRRRKSEPPRRPNIEPGVEADFEIVDCG